MGSYDNIVKIEAMRRRVEENDLASALKILETITIKKIKNMSDLSLIAEVYAGNKRYEEALQLYHKIYEKTRTRKALYQLVDLSIKTNNLEDAQFYLVEYQKVAPRDFYKYIFRYKLDKLMGAPYEKLIETLEALKDTEYMEKWAYELAKTYYKAGMDQECIKECSDIILWFGDGPYVEKAKILKSYFSGETNKEKIMEELKRRATGTSEKVTVTETETEKETEKETGKETETETELETETEKEIENETEIEDFDEIAEKLRANLDSFENMDEITHQQAATYIEEDREKQKAASYPYEVDGAYAETGADQEVETYTENFEMADMEAVGDGAEIDIRWNAIASGFELDLYAIFGEFLSELAVKRQIIESLELILEEDGEPVRMLITGEAGAGKTTLAKAFTLFFYEAGMLGSSKIAKIDAQKLNTIDLSTKRDTLRDCCLVIEHAGKLQAATIMSLMELCNSLWGSIAVILEDNQDNAQRLFMEQPNLVNLFRNQIHL